MKKAINSRALFRAYGWCCCLLPAAASIHSTYAQQSTFGNIAIHSGAQNSMSGTHYFETSRAGSQPGIVQTSRKIPFGVLNFKTPVTSPGSDERFVDGYVGQSGSSVPLIFPVGDKGRVNPFILQGGRAVPINAKGAYFAADPQVAQSDNMAGQPDATPLPAGAPFSRSIAESSIGSISRTGYWDIDCASSTQLTLSWGATSDIPAISGGSLSNLMIVGWHNAQQKWVAIPSAFDQGAKFGDKPSSLTQGTISTTGQIVANDYTVFTIAGKLTKVRLAVKLFLEGGTGLGAPVGTMRNDLQRYENDFGQFISLLREKSPYLPEATYPEIGNVAGPAGAVVDWVKIEVRSAAGAQPLLEAKSLLLKTDGSVVDVDGGVPQFNPQSGAVRVIVRHRNHLGISSNDIGTFTSGDVAYDFTDGIGKAFKDNPSDPPLMKEITPGSNKWCLWTADILNDATIDSADLSPFDNDFSDNIFEIYDESDVNLDGVVDSVDAAQMDVNFLKDLFSNIPLDE